MIEIRGIPILFFGLLAVAFYNNVPKASVFTRRAAPRSVSGRTALGKLPNKPASFKAVIVGRETNTTSALLQASRRAASCVSVIVKWLLKVGFPATKRPVSRFSVWQERATICSFETAGNTLPSLKLKACSLLKLATLTPFWSVTLGNKKLLITGNGLKIKNIE
jgi:hypothetical protein